MSTENNELKIISVSVFFVACVAFTCVLYWLRPIAVPLILAVFSTIILKSAVDFLKQRIKCPRILAILLTLFFALTIIILLVAFISSTLGQFISNADFYQNQLEELFRSASSKLNLQQYHITPQNIKDPLIEKISTVGPCLGVSAVDTGYLSCPRVRQDTGAGRALASHTALQAGRAYHPRRHVPGHR